MDDINPALRAELMAAIEVLEPQIRGLHDLELVSISGGLLSEIATQTREREERRALIEAVLAAMDAVNAAYEQLVNDGYPALPPDALPPDLMDELRWEMADLAAARAVFQEDTSATTVTVSLGNSEPKLGVMDDG